MLLIEKIEKFLAITNMGKHEFAKRAGISLTTFGKILNGVDVSSQSINSCQRIMQETLKDLITIAK